MIKFLSGEDFRFLWLPIITIMLTILIKIIYKDKRMGWFSWSDLSVAPNLMVTALFIYLIKMSLLALAIQNSPGETQILTERLLLKCIIFSGFLVGIISFAWLMRENGWKKEDFIGYKLKPGAIIISDLIGAFYLMVAYNY